MVDLHYTGENIRHTDGLDYKVLDTSKLDFEVPEAKWGKKVKLTLVRIAKPGEEIITSPGKVEESRVTAQGGEAIFINRLPGDKEDAFIPRDAGGTPTGHQILEDKYDLVGGDIHGEGAFYRPKGPPSKILHEAVKEPTAIKDARGPGRHQFLGEGATLKQRDTRVTGIDRDAFRETWAITDEMGKILEELGEAAGMVARRGFRL